MSQTDEDVVRRSAEEMMNQGSLDAADEVCAPLLADEAEKWVAPVRVSFPDVHVRVVTPAAAVARG